MKSRIFPRTLEKVLITAQMRSRPARVAHPAADGALAMLQEELASAPVNVWQTVSEYALNLCGAHSAGVSVVEFQRDEAVFRWQAVAGKWGCYAGGCLPRHASPCGVVIDLDATQLMKRPARAFPLLRAVQPEPVEALLAPFKVLGESIGAVWVLSHDETLQFASEDARLLEGVASLAGSAFLDRQAGKRRVA